MIKNLALFGAIFITITSYAAQIQGFTLVNANNGNPVADFDPLMSGAILNLNDIAAKHLNIRANTVIGTQSVAFQLDGNPIQVRSFSPFYLCGFSDGVPLPCSWAEGSHLLKAIPWSGINGTGTPGDSQQITFTVTTQSGPIPTPTPSVTPIPTVTPSPSTIPTPTPTVTPTPIPTITQTPIPTPTGTSTPPAGGNFVNNPIFDLSTSGWTITGSGTVETVNYVGPSGESYPHALKLVSNATTTSEAYQIVTGLKPRTLYTVAVKMKGSTSDVPPTLDVSQGVQNEKAYSYMDPEEANLWLEKRFVFYTDANSTSARVALSIYQADLGATAYFTSVRVMEGIQPQPVPEVGQPPFFLPVAIPSLPVAGQNLIQNATFKSSDTNFASQGKYFPWIVDPRTLITTQGGETVVSLAPTATDTSRSVQIIPFLFAPNKTYSFTADVLTVGQPGASVYMTDQKGAIVFSQVMNSPSWSTVSVPFSTGSTYLGPTKLVLEAYKQSTGIIYFKNIRIVAFGNEWIDTPNSVPPMQTQPFTEDFSQGLSSDKWLIADKQWGGDNGGVSPQNVKIVNGILNLEAHGDQYSGTSTHGGRTTRVGAAIVTRNYYASGKYEVVAKIPPVLGAATAFWPFHYIQYLPGQAKFWDEPNPIRNTEIDWELPTSSVDASGQPTEISLQYARANCWGGQLGGEGGEYSGRVDFGKSIADGQFHNFGIEWHSGADMFDGTRTPGTIAWTLDGQVVKTFQGKTFGQDNVPYRGARFWIGIWFPASGFKGHVGWAGDPNFDNASLQIKSVKITPFNDSRDAWEAETLPNGYFASPSNYPSK